MRGKYFRIVVSCEAGHEIGRKGEKLLHAAEDNIICDLIKEGKSSWPAGRPSTLACRDLHWSYILDITRENKIASFLYHTIKKSGLTESLPPGVRREFRRIYHRMALSNWALCDEMQRVIRELGDNDIRVIAIKGAALVLEVFENVATRHLSDIDLLIQEQDMAKAGEILEAKGYISSEGFRSSEWYMKNHHHLVPYRSPRTGAVIELHRNIVRKDTPFNINLTGFWARARKAKKGEINVFVLCPEDLIVNICLHLAWCNSFDWCLKALVDIDLCVRHYNGQIDWNLIFNEAQRGGYLDYVYYPLYLTKDIFGSSIPEYLLKRLKNKRSLGCLEDYLLRLLIRKGRVFQCSLHWIVPRWRVNNLCCVMIQSMPLYKKVFGIWEALVGPPDEFSGRKEYFLSPKLMKFCYPAYAFCRFIRRVLQRIGQKFLHGMPADKT